MSQITPLHPHPASEVKENNSMTQSPSSQASPQDGAQRPDTRILVVEDNPSFRKLVKTVLEEEGFQVLASEEPADVLNLAKTYQPSLVLMDVVLGETSGIVLCQKLKAQPY